MISGKPNILDKDSLPKHPILTAADVTDLDAEFVADPFVYFEEGVYYMFFEVLNKENGKGVISLATSRDGKNFQYKKVILEESFHLSYPNVFKIDNKIYMVPESSENNDIRLYEAVDFPMIWKFNKTLINDRKLVDATFLQSDGIWYMFASSIDSDTLHLFYSESFFSDWKPHRMSPIYKNEKRFSRPAGNILKYENLIIRYTQDCSEKYGMQIYAYKILEINPESYVEEKLTVKPFIYPMKSGYLSKRVHTLNGIEVSGKWEFFIDSCGYISR